MIHDVAWLEEAIRELHEGWRAADPATRAAIERALPRLNDRLVIAPYTQGETRSPLGMRIAFELPIRVRYPIERAGNMVTVLHADVVHKRRRP